MPGGIGPVSQSIIQARIRRDRAIAPVNNANEIFYHLDSRRVFFDSDEFYLYFVDSSLGLIEQTIRTALTGLRNDVAFEQMHLDRHKFFTGTRRIRLTKQQADTVLVALRLSGVRSTIQQLARRPISSTRSSPG